MKHKNALVLVDFEKEWIDKKSDYFVGDIGKEIKKTSKLIDYCRSKSFKIIFTRHIEPGSTTAFAKGSTNIEIIPELKKKSLI